MKKLRITWFAALAALCLAGPAAAGSWMAGVHGGMSMPMGDFADENLADAQSGFTFGVGLGYMASEMFAVGLELDMMSNKHGAEGETFDFGGGSITAEKDKFKTMHVGVTGMAMMPTSGPLKPFALVGLGLYNVKEDYEYRADTGEVFTDENEDAEQPGSRMGGKIGAGAIYKMNDRVGIGADGAFNFVSMDEDKFGTSSLQFIELRAKVMFDLMPR